MCSFVSSKDTTRTTSFLNNAPNYKQLSWSRSSISRSDSSLQKKISMAAQATTLNSMPLRRDAVTLATPGFSCFSCSCYQNKCLTNKRKRHAPPTRSAAVASCWFRANARRTPRSCQPCDRRKHWWRPSTTTTQRTQIWSTQHFPVNNYLASLQRTQKYKPGRLTCGGTCGSLQKIDLWNMRTYHWQKPQKRTCWNLPKVIPSRHKFLLRA